MVTVFTVLVEYEKAQEYTTETSALLQSILDLQLELSRLRSAHPFPHLTLSSAQARLEAQEEEMAECDATLSQLNAEADALREKLKETAKETERLKVEHSKIEEEVNRNSERKEEEAELKELYEWCVTLMCYYFSCVS